MSQYISIGKIVAIHGLKGAVVLKHALGTKTNLQGVKAIFTQDANSNYMPWFIQHTQARTTTETLIKIEEIDTPEAAKQLNQKIIWLTQPDFQAQASTTAPIIYIGYTIYENQKPLGIITEVYQQPHQTLCTIYINGKEVLIPLHQQSLINVNHTTKIIQVQLPQGLIELYTT
jgi:16S rRNA processing protein RimM